MYYYGARYYDPRLSIFISVDPLAEKYPSISPYAYVANNPVMLIDPDGRDFIFSMVKTEAGKTIITITLNAKIYNHSSKVISKEEGDVYANRIANSFKDFFGIKDDDFEVQVNANISYVTDMKDVKNTDHLINIYDEGKMPDPSTPGAFKDENVVGNAVSGGLYIGLSSYVVDGVTPATSGDYLGTGLSSKGYNTLERTTSHELGHSAGLDGHDYSDGNLMLPSSNPKAGGKVTKEQIIKIYENRENLNKGSQSY